MSAQSLVGSGTGVGLWPGRRREVERVFERGGNIVERRAPFFTEFSSRKRRVSKEVFGREEGLMDCLYCSWAFVRSEDGLVIGVVASEG